MFPDLIQVLWFNAEDSLADNPTKIERKAVMMTQSNRNPSKNDQYRAPVSNPGASMTVEAALTVPVFFFAVLCLIYLLEIHAIQVTVHAAAINAAKICTEDTAVIPVLNSIKLESEMVKAIGAERLNSSIIEDGSSGLSCAMSYLSPVSGELKVKVRYSVRLPVPSFTNLRVKFTEELKLSGWTGYAKSSAESQDGEIVYITENGIVYHSDYQCTYLQLSIRFVPYNELWGIRNEVGGIYYRCSKCVYGDAMAGVYITNSGGKYHNSLSCSGLKRTIYAVKKSEIIGRGGCSRCTE